MSWLFPDSALEADLVDCVEYSMAMEGAFTDAFKRNSSARKEMKLHKKAMNEAILAGDYKTASSEAETCAKILRDAANEIKATKPSMISNILTDVALFAAVELAQVIFFLKAGKEDQKKIQDKYAELDLKVAGGHFDNSGVGTLAIKHQKEYAETAEYMQTLNKKVQALVKDGKPVPSYLSEVNGNQIFMSKVVGAERDGALQKAKKATNTGIAVGGLATALSMLGNQMYDLKRAKDGKISPAEANAILKTVVRSLDQTADAYDKKAREYKFIGNGFESDMAAQEGFFSNMKAKFDERKAKYARDAELNGYFTEMEQKLEHLYGGHDGVEAILKLYVEYCSDKLIKGTNSAMAKLLKAFDSFDLNQKDPWIYSTSGYIFLVSDPVDGDDSELVWLPTKANVDAVNRGELDDAEYDEIWGSFDSNCIYLQICEAYAQKKYAETHPATEAWIFDEPAQEGFFSDMKAKSAAKRAEREADAAARKAYHEKEQKYYDQIDELYERQPAKAFAQAYSVLLDDGKDIASGPEAKKACDELCKIINDAEVVKVGRYFAVIQGDSYWVPSSDAKKTADDLKISQEIGDMANGHNIPDMFVDYVHEMMKRQEAGAFESWIFNEPAQEGWFTDKVVDSIARAQMKSSEQMRQQKSADEKKRIDAAKKALVLKSPKDVVAQFIQAGMAPAAVQKDVDYGNGGKTRPNLIATGSKAKSICSSKPNDDENFEYCWDVANVSKYETFTVGDISVVIAYAGNEPAGIGIPLTTMVLRTSEGYVEGTKAEVMKDPDLKENYEYGEYMESYFTPITWDNLVLKVAESITPATESEVVSSMGELEKAQAFVSAWLECHPDDMEPLYGPEADILLKEFRAKHVAEELEEDPDYVDPHEERHCGRLTYLVEVKPDTTNITIPVCWCNRNTTVEYGSKEIEESLCRYYDAAVQPQDGEVITEPAEESIFSAVLAFAKSRKDKAKATNVISQPSTKQMPTITKETFDTSFRNFLVALKEAGKNPIVGPWRRKLATGDAAKSILENCDRSADGAYYSIETSGSYSIGISGPDENRIAMVTFPIQDGTTLTEPAHWIAESYENPEVFPKERIEILNAVKRMAERAFLPMKQKGIPHAIYTSDYDYEDFIGMDEDEIIVVTDDWGELAQSEEFNVHENEYWDLLDSCAKDFANQVKSSKFGKKICVYGDGDKYEWMYGIALMSKYAYLKKVECIVESDMGAATEGFATNLTKKGLNVANKHLPKRVKEAQSARRKDVNAQTKANLQHASNQAQFFNTTAQVIYSQKGWLLGDQGKAKCEDIAARQQKNVDRVISAEVKNYSNLYYVLVHTKDPGYDEWVMYIPQVAGVKTRNLHQAAREIALIQTGKNGKSVPGFEFTITFG